MNLPEDRMPEAEVSLRLAFWLLDEGLVTGSVEVAIDGAQVRTKKNVHFEIEEFLRVSGWVAMARSESWRGEYIRSDRARIRVHSMSGTGDVSARLDSGQLLWAESKKGPLSASRSSAEYPLIREALGQILTIESAHEDDVLVVAVPSSEKFESLASGWRERPLIKKAGIQIATVDRKLGVRGLTVRK